MSNVMSAPNELISQEELLNRPLKTAVAIDPPNSFEIDDAINLVKLGRGDWHVEVHVADAGLLYGREDLIDLALARRESFYNIHDRDRSRLLLPSFVMKSIGLDAPSEIGVPSVEVAFDFNEKTRSIGNRSLTYCRVAVQSLTYQEHDSMMPYDKHSMQRYNVGRLLNQPKGKDHVFERGRMSSGIVGQFMVEANHVVAQVMDEEGIPWFFRNQGQETAFDMLRRSGEQSALASMRQNWALYGSRPHGHDELKLRDAYCHFTSPLRRVYDLANHLNLYAHRNGLPIPFDEERIECEADNYLRSKMANLAIAA